MRRLVSLALTALAVATCARAGWAAQRPNLEHAGTIHLGGEFGIPAPFLMDPVGRRMFLKLPTGGKGVLEFDLDEPVPTLVREVPKPSEEEKALNFTTIAVRPGSRQAFMLDYHPQGSTCPNCTVVKQLDLRTFTVPRTIANLSESVPNFYGEGLAYGAREDRVYVVGSVGGYYASYNSDLGFVKPTYPVSVVAIDVATGRVAWHRYLPQCQRASSATARGGQIFRSTALEAVYVPCIRPDQRSASNPGGQSGLVRIWIEPDAGQTEADAFRVDFFPISGKYTDARGVAGLGEFDYAADRLYMVSLSPETPGAWVFDGRLSAWVGFLPAYDNTNTLIGIDQASGRAFMRTGSDHRFVMSDGRHTPVPQGELFPYESSSATNRLLIDPQTHRVFVPATIDDESVLLVLRDRSGPPRAQEPVDYDALTVDIPEGANTAATFAGSVSGFGARVGLVGGYGGVVAPYDAGPGGPPSVPGVSPGDRGVFGGRVSSVDLRNVGASAGAQAIAPDTLTDEDRRTRQEAAREAGGDEAAALLDWPWPAQACLDGDGTAIEADRDGAGGTASAICDLERGDARAAARAAVIEAGPVTIGRSWFDTRARRDDDAGMITETTAAARGVEVDLPGTARLTIGLVRATARTVAHGRPGSADVRWVRTIEDAVLRDADGDVVFRCGSCDPAALADAVNEHGNLKARMTLPSPVLRATPGGAYAAVEEGEPDYYNGLIVNNDALRAVPALELMVYNDTTEKSRAIVQLAAIQASSIYGISPLPSAERPPRIPTVPVTRYTPTVEPGPVPDGAGDPPGGGGEAGPGFPGARLIRDPLLLVRSPADALMVSLVVLLIAGAVAAARQRLRLLRTLGPR